MKKYTFINVIIFVAVSCIVYSLFSLPTSLFDGDLFHQESTFSKIEEICREIWNDLEVIKGNEQLFNEWVEHSNYLVNQFLTLYSRIDMLIASPEESRIYLLDDISYLIEVIDSLNQKYQHLSHEMRCPDDILKCINTILVHSKIKLEQLLLNNQEVILC